MKKLIFFLLPVLFFACTNSPNAQDAGVQRHPDLFTNADQKTMADEQGIATFGAGCFWCVEAVFQRLSGVETVVSGYSGGHIKDPSYREVVSGNTGHAEVIQVTYDPDQITYAELLEIFWMTHDPTTLNRQGADVGTQYRSAVFFHNEEQEKLAQYYKAKIDDAKVYDDPIVTEITKFEAFYEAEEYHQNYYNNNPNQGYCTFVIRPKIQKLKEVFSDKLAQE